MTIPAVIRMDIVVISLLVVWPQLCFGVYTGNLAHGAYAVQSSTYNELADAQHAVDGNRDSNYKRGSCTHTEVENNPWLRVDLKNIYSVNKIIITNRGDSYAERIEGAQIRIGNSLDNNGNDNQMAATILTAPRDTETYTFNPINGRYINIFLPGMSKILSLCELEVYTGNLAHGAYAVQSSIYNELADAQHAVDGNRDSNYLRGSCTHTAEENDPWLRVDLKNIYSVNKIIITNRGDSYAERIEGAQIRIGNSLDNNGNDNQMAATILTAPRDTETYTFNPINGRYINIFLPGMSKILSLCELEVYTGNLAHGAYAVQSSIYNELADAQHAVDGNRDSNYLSGSCTHTTVENNPWLRVDLKNIYGVNKIIITNRGDSYAERIEGAQIRIGNSLDNNGNNNQLAATILTAPRDTETYTFYPINGRYINIFLPGMSKILSLCELEVYTGNLAHGAYAAQSSTYNELADAQHAVDGNRDSNYLNGSCTHTAEENNPWLRVHLKNIYSVNKIIITNRGDCCAERIKGAQIRIGNSLDNNGNNNQMAAIISTPPMPTETFEFNPIRGRYVNIFLPGMHKVLTLCEIEVYTDSFVTHVL